MDREAWRAVVHGVAQSQTWLSDWTELNLNRPRIWEEPETNVQIKQKQKWKPGYEYYNIPNRYIFFCINWRLEELSEEISATIYTG